MRFSFLLRTAFAVPLEVEPHAGTLLAEIGKGVSAAVLADATKTTLHEFLSTEPDRGTEYEQAKIDQLVNRLWNTRYSSIADLTLLADRVEWFEQGTYRGVEIAKYLNRRRKSRVSGPDAITSIERVEIDPARNFAVAMYKRKFQTNEDRRVGTKEIVLIGTFRSNPRVHALKRA
jgi:hypothetical protein